MAELFGRERSVITKHVRINDQEQKLASLRRTVGLLEQTITHQAIGLDEARGLLQVITDYAYALTTLSIKPSAARSSIPASRKRPPCECHLRAMENCGAGYG